jgi:pectinesterase
MKDQDIYLVPTTNSIQWGRRIYYAGCHKQGGKDFAWFQDNLPSGITKKSITIAWVFGEKWNPQKTEE